MAMTVKEIKRQFPHLQPYKLRAIASGKYLGIRSTPTEMKYAKMEIKNRGLRLKL